jgi:hypothetical protein
MLCVFNVLRRRHVILFVTQHMLDIVPVPKDVGRRLQQAQSRLFAPKIPLPFDLAKERKGERLGM